MQVKILAFQLFKALHYLKVLLNLFSKKKYVIVTWNRLIFL